MGASYHQFCPVAKAMELLDERWTLLVVRELSAGSWRFNQLRRGLPRMSPALLSRRLQQLTRAGVVERVDADGEVGYQLTAAGRELRPIVEALGSWGTRWVGRLGDADLDPKLLLWDMHRHVDHDVLGERRVSIRFDFPDVPGRARVWWLIVAGGGADVCDSDPGYPVDLTVTATLRALTDVWVGALSWSASVRAGLVRLDGDAGLRRALPQLLTGSDFAAVHRPPAASRRGRSAAVAGPASGRR